MSDQSKYRILLLEDNVAVRERVAEIIQQWEPGKLLPTCGTVAEAIPALKSAQIDILIADLNLPDGSGVDVIRAFRALHPNGQAVVLSVLTEAQIVLEAIRAGAIGYILKDDNSIGIRKALDMIMEGNSPMSPMIARQIIQGMHAPVQTSNPDEAIKLTPRELEVLNSVSRGFTYKEIAEMHGISVNTVTVHARNIYRKLEASNRTEAVFEAQKMGIISL